jgi:hypothetical protein
LSLLFSSASVKAKEAPAQTWRITAGGGVTTLDWPIVPEEGLHKIVFNGKSGHMNDTEVVVKGRATMAFGAEALFIAADQIVVKFQGEKEKKTIRSISVQGDAVLKFGQNNRQVMQIAADNVVLEPQPKSQ